VSEFRFIQQKPTTETQRHGETRLRFRMLSVFIFKIVVDDK
jgi:hypothetical protein